MFEYVIPVDTQAPIPHSVEAFDETLYGLDGVNSVMLDGRKVVVGAGTSLPSLGRAYIKRRTAVS
jgi:hypothetical protein